ncbi:hypothetical protein AB1Y20_022421 [Prymnesium parvum]|uniref:Centrosomal protein of 70 kDa n=1 Tax=Prymnesium parvum TaxID=97485 RepID=A0AB34JFU6_PRYPA
MGHYMPPSAERPRGERSSARSARDHAGNDVSRLGARVEELEAQLRVKETTEKEWEHSYAELQRKRASDRRRAGELEVKNAELLSTIEELKKRVAEGPSRKVVNPITNSSTFSERVTELTNYVSRMYNVFDLPRLFVSVLKKLSTKKGRPDLRNMIKSCKGFQPVLKKIHAERDAACARHLRENVYSKEAFSLVRLIVRLSKRECALTHQVVAFV